VFDAKRCLRDIPFEKLIDYNIDFYSLLSNPNLYAFQNLTQKKSIY